MSVVSSLPAAVSPGDQVAGFGADPWWLVLLKVVVIFALLVVLTLFNIWYERRLVARMQHRVGPNRQGPAGLLQSLSDGVKLALKEDIVPKNADKVLFWLAPAISVIPAFMVFAVVPFGPEVSIFGVETRLQLTDLPVAVLYVLAVTSIGVYGLVLAGWSSGSTYPLLGGLRSSAQVISYELAMGLSFVAVFLYAGSMSTSEIVEAQTRLWFAVALVPSFLVYLVSMVGETNRAPFDLPEAEGELVGGFHTEYSSLKFALFFLAEYVNMVNVSAIATTLFLGGWRAPWPLSAIGDGVLNTGWWPVLWFLAKVMLCVSVFVWLRGTLPRLRYDQFMGLGWKVLIPFSLGWIVLVSGLRLWTSEAQVDRQTLFLAAGVLAAVLLALTFIPTRAKGGAEDASVKQRAHPASAGGVAGSAGRYPVPPPSAAQAVATPVGARSGTTGGRPQSSTETEPPSA